MLDPTTFAYDQQAPLALEVLAEHAQEGALVRDITYASPHGGKVSAYLIVPSPQKPQSGLIFGHWGEGNREEFVQEAIVLARLGFVSLCLDSPHRRAAAYEPQRAEPQAELQWIVDVRRGVDLLLEQCAFPLERLGYVGHSYGASYGGTIAGIEHRFTTYVLMAGWYSTSELTRTSTNPVLVEQRKRIPAEVLNVYLTAMAPLDAQHYIGHAAPAQLFFELASVPKQIAWYEHCGHEFNAQARLDRAIWLCETWHLPQPAQEVLNLLEQVPSPTPLEG